ncbi:MAG: chorismate synthase, partial [Muribaculaceae bacterium]|nr:chorismate synthase [Muribaculaceae bacterium]
DIYFNVAFKPVATLLQEVETIDRDGNTVTLKARGRHDPCVVPRAVPVVEAMAAMTLLDAMMLNASYSL